MTTSFTKQKLVNALPGEERGVPSVNESGPSAAKRGLIIISILLLLASAGGLGYWKYQKNSTKITQAKTQKSLQLKSAVPARTFSEATSVANLPPIPSSNPSGVGSTSVEGNPSSMPTLSMPPPQMLVPVPLGSPELPTSVDSQPLQVLDKSESSLMTGGGSARGATENTQVAMQPRGGQGENAGELDQENGSMAQQLSGTATPMRKAGMLGNQNFILAKGSFINCALQTRLDSTIPGMTACVLTRNIYSDNGKVLLLERGSTASGEYKSNLKQGMARIGVLWTRVKTPSGVVINLDSGGTDQLGGAGVPGYIDDHFWKRFGGAILISMIGDVSQGLMANKNSGGDNQINFNGSADAAENMGVEVLKNTINIPPTLYKNQGEEVGIYVSRDLDFSSVYDVAAK
ncbi:MAG: TrbI/VirB10 family protein [Proteobacteria bacterium]|nr:MAG: TrbI/VirB10 family protein [Pseudomonadota bacterium]